MFKSKLEVSINSTSYKGSDMSSLYSQRQKSFSMFPLIPLPIKEAIFILQRRCYQLERIRREFPLIPLPIKEAICLQYLKVELIGLLFPLIPLPIKEAICTHYHQIHRMSTTKFPLIPLPIKEAIFFLSWRTGLKRIVSINSTSYKGSDLEGEFQLRLQIQGFPLIPLPIKEAIIIIVMKN